MLKRIGIITLLITFSAFGQKGITLDECLKKGISQNLNIDIAKLEYQKAEDDVTIATSYMLPELKFSASYTRLSNVPDFEVTVPFMPTPIKLQETVLNSYSLKASVTQPLFTGFRLTAQRKAARLVSESNNKLYEKAANDVALEIHLAFWNYFKAVKLDSLTAKNIKSVSARVNDTKKFLEQGLVTKSDLLFLEVKLSDLHRKKLETENLIKLAQIGLNKAMGNSLDENLSISIPNIVFSKKTVSRENLADEAAKKRSEILSGELLVKASEEKIVAAKSEWMPSVYLFGDYYYANPNQRYMPVKDEFNDSWDVGVSMQWNLFNWGRRGANINKAQKESNIAKYRLKLAKQNIEQQVSAEYYNYLTASETVKVSSVSVSAAEENLRIVEKKFNEQLVSSTDLLEAQTTLFNSETELTNSLVDYQMAKVRLNYSTGKIIY